MVGRGRLEERCDQVDRYHIPVSVSPKVGRYLLQVCSLHEDSFFLSCSTDEARCTCIGIALSEVFFEDFRIEVMFTPLTPFPVVDLSKVELDSFGLSMRPGSEPKTPWWPSPVSRLSEVILVLPPA